MTRLIIRGGSLVDGTGRPPFEADVAIEDGRITEVGQVAGGADEEIDARGMLVTPGFIDIHTHYDGNITWEDRIRPSSAHGVTTVVTGNCGVGFAPCRPEDRDRLIGLMAGVEDIPEVVMAEGLPWNWQSFPEYLDAVAARSYDMDVAVHLPHSALRVFVMGQRAIDREPATPADVARMAELTREAIEAGAIGFATSRALHQRSVDGEPIPTVRAAEAELTGIALALKASGKGVLQMLSDFGVYEDVDGEFAMMRRLVEQSGRPLSYTLHQRHSDPEGWRQLLSLTDRALAAGLPIRAQVGSRPTGVLLGYELTMHPFVGCAGFEELVHLPYADRVAELRTPARRGRILAEFEEPPRGMAATMASVVRDFGRMFPLDDNPDYEPSPETSVAAEAARRNITPAELAYDLMLEDDGHNLLLQAAQDYAYGVLQEIEEMLRSQSTIMGLGDGGAHCGMICDASWPTYMMTHWARDRSRGPRLPLPTVVKRLTADAARAVGLEDRGVIAPGYKADLNIVNFDRLRLHRPNVAYDLPSGGRRIVQAADGYVATIVNGTVVYRDDGKPTGALPGRLVRGPQPPPPPT